MRNYTFNLHPWFYNLLIVAQVVMFVLALFGSVTWVVALIPSIIIGLLFSVVAPVLFLCMYLFLK